MTCSPEISSGTETCNAFANGSSREMSGKPLQVTPVDDEFFLTITHEMSKQHYISFIVFVSSGHFELVKLYPEGNAETRMSLRGGGLLYWYCNRHGLFCQKV